MKEEFAYMDNNQVKNLVPLPKGVKLVGCKWVFKPKRNSKDEAKRYKAKLIARNSKIEVGWYKGKLVAKGFIEKQGIDTKRLLL